MSLWLLSMLACKDGAEAEETAAPEPEQVWPTQDKVLFFTGWGGRSGSSTGEGGSDEAAAWLEATYGWTAQQRDTLGEAETFRAIFFMDPGFDSAGFSDEQVEGLLGAMALGTRLIVLADRDTCAGPLVNPLLTALGVPMQLSGERRSGVAQLGPASDHQAVAGLGEVYLNDPCDLDTNGATPLFTEDRSVYGGAWRPGHGGDVVLLGDLNFMDDSGRIDNGDNRALLGRLVEVGP